MKRSRKYICKFDFRNWKRAIGAKFGRILWARGRMAKDIFLNLVPRGHKCDGTGDGIAMRDEIVIIWAHR